VFECGCDQVITNFPKKAFLPVITATFGQRLLSMLFNDLDIIAVYNVGARFGGKALSNHQVRE
jgi:hypothetical protein